MQFIKMDSLFFFGLRVLGLLCIEPTNFNVLDSGVRMLWGRTSLWSVQIRRSTIESWSGTTLNWEKLCFLLSTGKSLNSIDHCLCQPHQHRGNITHSSLIQTQPLNWGLSEIDHTQVIAAWLAASLHFLCITCMWQFINMMFEAETVH